jgi:hypothetical protein
VVGGCRLGGQGAWDPGDPGDRVPARLGLEDGDVCRDHGVGARRGARPGYGYQQVPSVRGTHPQDSERSDHDADAADAHVRDPRSRQRVGHAVVDAQPVLPWRLADIARQLLPVVLRPGWKPVRAERELLRACTGDQVRLFQPGGRTRGLRRRVGQRNGLRCLVSATDPPTTRDDRLRLSPRGHPRLEHRDALHRFAPGLRADLPVRLPRLSRRSAPDERSAPRPVAGFLHELRIVPGDARARRGHGEGDPSESGPRRGELAPRPDLVRGHIMGLPHARAHRRGLR